MEHLIEALQLLGIVSALVFGVGAIVFIVLNLRLILDHIAAINKTPSLLIDHMFKIKYITEIEEVPLDELQHCRFIVYKGRIKKGSYYDIEALVNSKYSYLVPREWRPGYRRGKLL